MKKVFIPILFLLSSMVITSCGGNNGESSKDKTTTEENPSSIQLLGDNKFVNGFSCTPGSGNRQDDGWFPEDRWQRDVDLQYGNPTAGPSWMMSQHGDIYSLNDKYNKFAGGKPVDNGDGSYTFFDESKVVTANPEVGSLYLELNTSHEYVRPRKDKEEWCHILLNQGFSEAVTLSEVDSVDFTIDLDLKKFEDHMDGHADTSLHAAQFLMYIVVKSEGGANAGDWFWFGIPFYDNRYPTGLPEGGNVDAGGAGATSKYIYHTATNTFLPGGLQLNQKASIAFDVKPAIEQALVYANTKGFMVGTVVEDLVFQSMNIGWEVPGTYDVGVEISNFSLTANY